MRFILIDRLVELVPGKRATAVKTFDEREELFLDHFPGSPMVPGVLLTEVMSQTAGWLLLASLDFGRWPLLNMVQSAKFRRPAGPGQELSAVATIESISADSAISRTSISIGGARIADATLFFHHSPLPEHGADSQFASWVETTFASLGGATARGDR